MIFNAFGVNFLSLSMVVDIEPYEPARTRLFLFLSMTPSNNVSSQNSIELSMLWLI